MSEVLDLTQRYSSRFQPSMGGNSAAMPRTEEEIRQILRTLPFKISPPYLTSRPEVYVCMVLELESDSFLRDGVFPCERSQSSRPLSELELWVAGNHLAGEEYVLTSAFDGELYLPDHAEAWHKPSNVSFLRDERPPAPKQRSKEQQERDYIAAAQVLARDHGKKGLLYHTSMPKNALLQEQDLSLWPVPGGDIISLEKFQYHTRVIRTYLERELGHMDTPLRRKADPRTIFDYYFPTKQELQRLKKSMGV